jgi:predicted GIY-YIG superfamily endonuclease
MYVIYALIDPRDNTPRYVGITDDVYARFSQHLRCDSSNFRRDAWIKELKAAQFLAAYRVKHNMDYCLKAVGCSTVYRQHARQLLEGGNE